VHVQERIVATAFWFDETSDKGAVMSLRHRFVAGFVTATVLASAAAFVTIASPAAAATKTLGGELQCGPGDRVSGVWLLGSSSVWHGFDYQSNKRPYVGGYSITAVQGETIKAWIRCVVLGESYSSFTVGRGSTRHICAAGWRCGSVNLGWCAIQAVYLAPPLRIAGCVIRYVR